MRYLPTLLPLLLFIPAAQAAGVQTATLTAFAPVPEPMIWSMMIAGFGFAGSALRRAARRRGVSRQSPPVRRVP